MTALVWHRTDLRLRDNAAVDEAMRAASGQALGVYVLPARPYEEVLPEVPRWSPRRLGFLLECLDDLAQAWRALGSALVVVSGEAHEALPEVAAAFGAREVHTAPCLAVDERRENDAVFERLRRTGVGLRVHEETTLFAAEELPLPIDALPDVFSTFRRAVLGRVPIRPPRAAPSELRVATDLSALAEERTRRTLDAHELSSAREALAARDARSALPFEGGRRAGLARLEQWMWRDDRLARYKETRDGLIGIDDSSKLSPYLATGALSPREVYAELVRYEAERLENESTRWFVFELVWRDYFHFWVRKWRARAFARHGVLGRTACGVADAVAFARWRAGETGEPFVDAGMRELCATGYLSNRARQNVASWLARTAGVDWRWGAAWFESQLFDHDVGPNWGNWQYVAGVGNDPRNRVFDVRAQADRYDADGAYRRLWADA
ncbi:MAG: DASH family cryptochrome [Deltaproteobacteria bacterium]|nr:DASH family cryptochrome [Deltaproteobacteria bacterium]